MKHHQNWLAGQLKNDDFAASYLTQAAQDWEPAVFTTFTTAMRSVSVSLSVAGRLKRRSNPRLSQARPPTAHAFEKLFCLGPFKIVH